MSNCNQCNLCNTRFQQLALAGNCAVDDCELLIITDYPKAEDDASGYPLTGNQYAFLWELLGQVGVKYLVTSLVKCIPIDLSTRRYRKPTQEEYEGCMRANFFGELKSINPQMILLFGQATVDILVPGKKVADLRDRSSAIMIDGSEYKVLGTYHPNYVVNSDNEMFYNRFIEDIVYACRHAMKKRNEGKYKTITINADQYSKIVDIWCNDESIEYVGYDTESNGLEPWIPGSKITSLSVAVDDQVGYNIFLYHPEIEISDEDREKIKESSKKLLTTKKVVVHHAKHEHRYAKVCFGFTPNIVDDTMYMAYILYMSYPGIRYGLKYLAGRFISMPPWEEYIDLYAELFKKMKRYKSVDDKIPGLLDDYKDIGVTEEDLRRFWDILNDPNYYIKQAESDKSDVFYWMVPARVMEQYAGMDAIAPLLLHKIFKPMIDNDPGLTRTYKLMVEGAEVFANIELKGVRIHDLERWTERYDQEIESALAEIRSFKEVQQFEMEQGVEYNPNSSQQNVDVFFSKFGFPVKGLTGKGDPSTSETNLISMIMEYEAMDNRTPEDEDRLKFLLSFRKYKKLKKIMSSYFIGLREYIRNNDAFDGHRCKLVEVPEGAEEMHMHPGYTLHGTETGRLSSQSPSLHTIPSNSEVKKIIVPHNLGRGGLFVMADYSQAELRVLASVVEKFYGDTSMAEAYRQGRDLHRFTASKVFNKPEEEVLDAERRFSKTISFSITYGSSEASVAESTGRTPQEVHDLFEYYYQSFPGIKMFIQDMHKYVTAHGCVRTPMGRIRHIREALDTNNRGAFSSAMRKAQNTPIQSSASDVAVSAVVMIDKLTREQNLKTKVVGTVHDSIYVDVHPGEIFEGIDILKYAMKTYPEETFEFLTCPMGVDLELSTNLADHLAIKSMTVNDDGSRTFTLKGYDFVMDNVLNELKMAYDVEETLLKEQEHDTGDASLIARRVITLTQEGVFNEQTKEVRIIPRGL